MTDIQVGVCMTKIDEKKLERIKRGLASTWDQVAADLAAYEPGLTFSREEVMSICVDKFESNAPFNQSEIRDLFNILIHLDEAERAALSRAVFPAERHGAF